VIYRKTLQTLRPPFRPVFHPVYAVQELKPATCCNIAIALIERIGQVSQ
jgi:hypothetical protein